VIGPYIVAETGIHRHDIDACRSTRLMDLHRKRTPRSFEGGKCAAPKPESDECELYDRAGHDRSRRFTQQVLH
jgi:hypothetical protein